MKRKDPARHRLGQFLRAIQALSHIVSATAQHLFRYLPSTQLSPSANMSGTPVSPIVNLLDGSESPSPSPTFLIPTASTAVYDNDLIMSEIVFWLFEDEPTNRYNWRPNPRAPLSNMLLVDRRGFRFAAAMKYRNIGCNLLERLVYGGCSFVSISSAVPKLTKLRSIAPSPTLPRGGQDIHPPPNLTLLPYRPLRHPSPHPIPQSTVYPLRPPSLPRVLDLAIV